MLRSIRETNAIVTDDAGGSGNGEKCSVSTPEPRIKVIRAGPDAEACQGGAILRVLHDDLAARRRDPQQSVQQPVAEPG